MKLTFLLILTEFLDLFSDLFSLDFSLNCGYFFCLTCKTMKITVKEQKGEEIKKNKRIIFNSKDKGYGVIAKGSFTYDIHKKV